MWGEAHDLFIFFACENTVFFCLIFSWSPANATIYYVANGATNNCYINSAYVQECSGYAQTKERACQILGEKAVALGALATNKVPLTVNPAATGCITTSGGTYGSAITSVLDNFCSYFDANGNCTTPPDPPPIVIENCSDGYPPNLNGYAGCDRPSLKICTNGSYVDSQLGVCSSSCTDYQTCYNSAIAQVGVCSGATYTNFNYVDPLNYSISCGDIPPASPDSSANGGNQDGNIYNDPQSTTPSAGSTTSTTDLSTVGQSIKEALQPEFSTLERAINKTTDQISKGDVLIRDSINSLSTTTSNGSSDVVNSVDSLNNTSQITNSKLDTISGLLASQQNGSIAEPGIAATWWEPRYPDGMSGQITSFIAARSTAGPISNFVGSWGIAENGTVPEFGLNVQMGPFGFGYHSFAVPSIIWIFLKMCILLTALFTARSLIFGG